MAIGELNILREKCEMKVKMRHFVNVTQRSGLMMGRSSGPTPILGLSPITSKKLSLRNSGDVTKTDEQLE